MKPTFLNLALAAVSAACASNRYAAETTAATPAKAPTPAALPGKGTAQHPFLYAGEWDTRKPLEQSMFIVREGKVDWQYTMPLRTPGGAVQEFDDATLLANGNVIFSKMSGAGMVSPDKKIVWEYPAPPGTEIHSCQSIGKDRVLIMRNGNPAQAMIINTTNGNTVICNWCAGNNKTQEWAGTVQVFEVTPDKKVVWALSSWHNPDLGPSTSIQLLDEPGALEDQER